MLRSRTALAIATVVLAAGAPAAQAGQDLRSPDARDAARRSPVRVYSYYGSDATRVQDLRSPDARDAVNPTAVPPTVTRSVRVVDTAPAGFDWTDAAIGAAASFGLILLVGGGLTVAGRRRLRTA